MYSLIYLKYNELCLQSNIYLITITTRKKTAYSDDSISRKFVGTKVF